MVQLNLVQRDRLEAFIKDQRTVFDFETLFAAVIELQAQITAMDLYTARAGDIVWSAGTTRTQALPALGGSYLRASYPALFAAIGTTYGAVDGTHFTMPNLGGRVVAGKEAVATNITTAVSGFSGATLGATGGLQNHLLTIPEMPNHDHAQHPNTQLSGGASVLQGAAGTTDFGQRTGFTGGGLAHRNVQPTIILNAFILY